VNHHQPVAERGGVGHRVDDHHGGQVLLADDLLGESNHLLSAPRVQGGGVLVEQKELRPPIGGHEESQGLALASGEAAIRIVAAVLKAHAQRLDPLTELGHPAPGDRAAQTSGEPTAGRQGEVLGNRQAARSFSERVLENAADQTCLSELGPAKSPLDPGLAPAARAGLRRSTDR
jgi:hypothetical protein